MRFVRGIAILFVLTAFLLAGEAPGGAPPPEARRAAIEDQLKAGRYADAERAARDLLAQVTGPGEAGTPEAARVINLLVEAMWRGGKAKDPEARSLAEKSVGIMERSYGREALETAESLSVLGRVCLRSGDYPAARTIFEEALAIRQKLLPPDDIAVSMSLGNLSATLRLTGDYEAALPLATRALTIAEQRLGPEDPDLANAVGNMAMLEHELGNFDKARSLYERALAIDEKSLGQGHAKTAKSLSDLANLLADTGDNEGARPLYQRALDISETVLGPGHPDTANYLNNLAIVLQDTGDLAGARPLYERALAIYEKMFGPDHPKVALALTNLGSILYEIGDYGVARPLFERALVIREKSLGADHVEVGICLGNLAGDLIMLGDLKTARPLLERSVKIKEKALGPDSTSLAYSLHDLAIVLREMGDYDAAEQTARRALSIMETGPLSGHPLAAEVLGNLARIRAEKGDYRGARELVERAHAIALKALGPTHPTIAEGLELFASLELATGAREEALKKSLQGEAIARESFRRTASGLSEREALGYEKLCESGLDVTFSAVVSEGKRLAGSLARVWDETVRSRAMVLDEMAQRHRVSVASEDPEVAALATRLRTARSLLARLVVSGTQQESAEEYRQRLAEAQEEEESAERALAKKSAAFSAMEARGSVGLAEVARALPADAALVAYVLYGRLVSPGDQSKKGASSPLDKVPSYVALVLPSGRSEPLFVSLGPAQEIDARVRAWRKEVSAAPPGLATAGDRSEVKYRQAGEALRRAVWDPVSKHLQGAPRVFVVPDGALNLVSLATLPTKNDRYLVETVPVIHYLSAERDLAREDTRNDTSPGLLVLGGPDFDADPRGRSSVAEAQAASSRAGSAQGKDGVFRGRRAACAAFRSLKFQPLPASRVEAEAIGALWKSQPAVATGSTARIVEMIGGQATEADFKGQVAGHQIVHMATHGFFVDDRCTSALDRALRDEDKGPRTGGSAETGIADNPLLLTGLALAGANRRDQAGSGEDGILTAEEIASLDLSGARWVVLSACETGLGRVQAGEGVQGLRRSFEVAGAATLIMSLWSVEDAAARDWMERLYKGRLEGLPTDMAVRDASLGMIESRRKAGRSTHPFYWGAFVAAGDWR